MSSRINPFFKIAIFILFFAFCIFPKGAKAVDINLSVSPSLIDVPSADIQACEKGRICLEREITIKNNSDVRADIYPQVNDISPEGIVRYSDPSELPADRSLTRWTDFYRAVIEIPPGESVKKTLKIIASPNAIPGVYHSIITFPPGGNMTEAQLADSKLNQAKLLLNIEVKAHIIEKAEVSLFKPAKVIFTDKRIGFLLKIKNIGNEVISPVGEIVIYNKGGKEVGSITVKEKTVAPNETVDFSSTGSFKILPGKYQAKLIVNYGGSNRDLQGNVYFSYLPLGFLIFFLLFMFAMIFVGAFIIDKRRREKRGQEGSSEEPEEAEEEYEEESDEVSPIPIPKGASKKHVLNLKK